MPLELWVVRHAETEWSASGRHTGRTDIPLTAAGERQARALESRLAGAGFDRVYTSPLERARRTAELAGFPDAVPEPLLLECDYGDYEGVTSAEIHLRRPGWELYRDGCPRGESPAQLARRAAAFVELAAGPGGRVLAIAHGHILRAVATAYLGWDITRAVQLSLGTAGIGILFDGDQGRALEHWNLTG